MAFRGVGVGGRYGKVLYKYYMEIGNVMLQVYKGEI